MTKRRTAMPVALTAAQRDRLESLWFVYGNYGPKETYGNHQFIQGFLERGEDARPLFTARTPARERPTPECEAAVDAVLQGEEAGAGDDPRKDAAAGRGLRLVKSPEAHPARAPEPDLARALEDLQRRYRERGVWEERAVTDRKRGGKKAGGR
jgi:hypothetical protein